MVGIFPGGCERVALGPGVITRCTITLRHPQKLAKRRGKADFGTLSDLNHLLEGVERSGLVLGGRDTGCGRVALGHGVIICGKIALGDPQQLATRRGKADFGTFRT